jgi:hypothetical protein
MHTILEEAKDSIESLAESIKSISSDKRLFTVMYGWNCPPLSFQDLADMATDLVVLIDKHSTDNIDSEISKRIELIASRIESYKVQTMPQLTSGNNPAAASAYIALIDWMRATLEPLFSWEALQDNKMLPTQLSRRLRSIQLEIEAIVPKKEELQQQIKNIHEAKEAAESLPIDLDSLREARVKIGKLSTDSAELFGKIDTYLKESASYIQILEQRAKDADNLVERSEEAYRITTSAGLAGAFHDRAKSLYTNMSLWVVGLLAALLVGGAIGTQRFQTLYAFLDKASHSQMHWGVIWMEFIISIIGLAAPIWFAWLATKQIRQCFVMAEDYSFKASVAKAYEGYRKEAVRIDSALEARLFSSALTRLEEPPLRLVGEDLHTSPWQEFFSSPAFHKALETIPALKTDFISLAKQGMSTLPTAKQNGKQVSGTEETE